MIRAWVVLLSTSHWCCDLTQRASVWMRKCADWVNLKFVYTLCVCIGNSNRLCTCYFPSFKLKCINLSLVWNIGCASSETSTGVIPESHDVFKVTFVSLGRVVGTTPGVPSDGPHERQVKSSVSWFPKRWIDVVRLEYDSNNCNCLVVTPGVQTKRNTPPLEWIQSILMTNRLTCNLRSKMTNASVFKKPAWYLVIYFVLYYNNYAPDHWPG